MSIGAGVDVLFWFDFVIGPSCLSEESQILISLTSFDSDIRVVWSALVNVGVSL